MCGRMRRPRGLRLWRRYVTEKNQERNGITKDGENADIIILNEVSQKDLWIAGNREVAYVTNYVGNNLQYGENG